MTELLKAKDKENVSNNDSNDILSQGKSNLSDTVSFLGTMGTKKEKDGNTEGEEL